MGTRYFYTEPPIYHDMEITDELSEKLLDIARDNHHFFIDRGAVEKLLSELSEADDDDGDDDRASLTEWLAAMPQDELCFSIG